MGLVVVQLSDIHFRAGTGTNPFLERAEDLCGAIRSVLLPEDSCVVVFSGDIADRGRPEEYEVAACFLRVIRDGIQEHLGKQPHFVIVPGNHDLDFEMPDFEESIRELILENSSQRNPPDQVMSEYCLKPQQPFRNFMASMSCEMQVNAPSSLVELAFRDLDGLAVQFCLLNTTRFTRRKEIPASTWFPIEALVEKLSGGQPGAICIGILHHTYDWFVSENSKDLRHVLEANCDIIFTGHEHLPDSYQKVRRATEQNLYMEGGVLQDHEDYDSSTFNIVRIEPEQQDFECLTFTWTGSAYERLTDTYTHRYHRLRQPLLKEFVLKNTWKSWLDEVGTDFLHPRCRELRLSYLFVYPDLQRLDVRKACNPTGTIRDRDVLGFVQEKKRLLIAGAERVGKTCLARLS